MTEAVGLGNRTAEFCPRARLITRATTLTGALLLGGVGSCKPGAAKCAPERGSRDEARCQATLHREVRHELVLLAWYSVFDNLAFRVDGDKVTLLGQVGRPTTSPMLRRG